MQAYPWPLNSIFSAQTRFIAPLFQRPYVWNWEENWVPLWETVHDVAKAQLEGDSPRPRFLGAIVLDQVTTLNLVPVREIIDGQQRLTTLQILLAAARDRYKSLCEEHGYNPQLLAAFEQMVTNNPPLQSDDDKFKVWPTNVDRDHFRRVMTAGSLEKLWESYGIETSWQSKGNIHHLWKSEDSAVNGVLRSYWAMSDEELKVAERSLTKEQRYLLSQHYKRGHAAKHNIALAYFFFWMMVEGWLEADDEAGVNRRAQTLLQALQNGIVLVLIGLDPGDDAQQIFETMNALGTPLLPADLVKNFLFREAELKGQPTEPLYEQYWKEFDKGDSWWREEVRQGRLYRHRLDVFLQHYLTLTTRREVPATELFHAYRNWAQSQNNTLSPSEQLERFHSYATIFQCFYSPDLPPRIHLFFERLKSLDVSTLFPVLLDLFRRHTGRNETLEEILVDLESFLVRRLVCGLTTKNYNRLFLELLQHLETQNDFSPDAIRAYLLSSTGDSVRWPDNAEFGVAWRTFPIYRKMNQERLRLLLRALDTQLKTKKNEDYTLTGSLSIEHIMPQSWQQYWPLPDGEDDAISTQKRELLLHTIGNLTLVSKALNPSLSNSQWQGEAGKRAQILLHSNLVLNKVLPDKWDENEIEKRSQDLLEAALEIWPYPGA